MHDINGIYSNSSIFPTRNNTVSGNNKTKTNVRTLIFIPGNSKTKQNGAITPDTMNEYENGKLVKTTVGFDDDDNGRIEGEEIWK